MESRRLLARKWEGRSGNRECSTCLEIDEDVYFDFGEKHLTFQQLKESVLKGCERCSLLNIGVETCIPAPRISNLGCIQFKRKNRGKHAWTHAIWIPDIGKKYRDRIEFSLFTLPGHPQPFPGILPGSICGNTESEESLLQAQKWILSCCSSHETCSTGAPRPLPKRIVDISFPNPRLQETHKELGRYVCLSHCWGNSRPPCATTSQTLEQNQKCIKWNSMPRTFRDAIHFTQRLGIRFIWIDSMCIIQDDEIGWREQSASMASIYQNAYLTLCSTHSSSDNGGCYSYLQPNYELKQTTIVKKNGKKHEVCFRVFTSRTREIEHIPDWDRATMSHTRKHFPLMTRAWTYQERLLSPRLLHFTSGELMWECSELRSCECTPTEELDSPFFRFHSEKKGYSEALTNRSPKIVGRNWRKIVQDYSSLELTFERDKLPTLSGVAKQIQSLRQEDEYLAGLWKNTLFNDLRWYVVHGGGVRPTVWRAPTWSWASIDGDVSFKPETYEEMRVYSRLLHASITLSGPDPTGEVSAGFILLSGPVISATMIEVQDRRGKFQLEAAGMRVSLELDSNADVDAGRLKLGDIFHCMRLTSASIMSRDICLVLKAVDTTPTFYQRVGHVEHDSELLEQKWFQSTNGDVEVKIL